MSWDLLKLYMDIFPFSAFKWNEYILCPPVLSEPTEKEYWKWLLRCFPSHLEHRLWGKPPDTGPDLTPGSRPYLLSLRNESWAASLYYEIKIVPEDHKGRKQNWFQLWLWSLQKSYRGGGAGSVLFLDKWTTKILFYSLPQRQQWDFS